MSQNKTSTAIATQTRDELRSVYNTIAQEWHDDHKSDDWWLEGADVFRSYVPSGARVLDVGCGGGLKSNYLSDRGLNLLGVDFSEQMIAIAAREYAPIEFRVTDVYDIEKLAETFDGIFAQAVLLHIPKRDIQSRIQALVGKLRTGGHLYIAVKEVRENGVEEEIKTEIEHGRTVDRFFSYFATDELVRYIEHAGCTVVYQNKKQSGRTVWLHVIARKV